MDFTALLIEQRFRDIRGMIENLALAKEDEKEKRSHAAEIASAHDR